ncbi:MAG TPA: metallophosphoesterase family protein [Bacteroidales bacterium]|nr:metallophosphoesterase family protein [Bacteroidales bacterium]
MKKWVIPDIHGCAKTLKVLLERQIQPFRDDLLIFLGDYIDRGPDSKGVVDYLMQLQADGQQMIALRGNHEEYLLLANEKDKELQKGFFSKLKKNHLFDKWQRHGGNNTLQSFGIKHPRQLPQIYLDWFDSLQLFAQQENFLFVHAGLNFERRDPLEDKHAMLWSRSFVANPEKIGGRVVVHGHVPVSLSFIQSQIADETSKYIPLDNGCYLSGNNGMGNLLAFELTTRQLLVQPGLDFV